MHALHPAPLAAWKFARMRPINLPTIRMAQFARSIMRCDERSEPADRIRRPCRIRELSDVEADGY
ncbi:MAG: DUF2851 family protein [Flavobacteriales bacterium]|nr:DUF2851 family protein [Flavobacteriales bacterium]